jgi:phage terminase large subunit
MEQKQSRARQAAETLRRFRFDSPGFVRHMFGVDPDPWQLDYLSAMDAGANVATRSGHGVGKTAGMAWGVIQTVACFPFSKVPCTAPTQHQLSDLLWAEIAYWLNRSKLKGILQWTATKLCPVGYEDSWFAVARACTVPENLAGFHAPKLRYFVDEGSGVADNIMEVVDGALTTTGAQLIMAGNPTRTSGYFYNAFHRARSQWHTLHVSSEDSPRVDPGYPDKMAQKWGRDTDIYRVRVLGDFPLAESDSFIPINLVEDAIARWQDGWQDSGPTELGVDVARYGDDETVFAVRRGGRVIHLERRRGWSVTQTAGRTIQLVREFGVTAAKIDDASMGGGVTDILMVSEELYSLGCVAVPINFGGEGDDYYHNATGVMWGALRDLLQAGQMALPDDEDLPGQFTTRRYTLSAKGKIVLERKEDMKKRGLPSPDIADAVALAFAQPQKQVSQVTIPHAQGYQWGDDSGTEYDFGS